MSCEQCPLNGCIKVPPHGAERPQWIIVGEAPGKEEERVGKPFVGVSGKLLRAVLDALKVKSETCWFTNACLCRPPRTDDSDEKFPVEAIVACRERLWAELQASPAPRVIAVGKVAAQALVPEWVPGVPVPADRRALAPAYANTTVRTSFDSTAIRGLTIMHQFLDKITTFTVHPAHCLRNPDTARDLLDDVKKAQTQVTPPSHPKPGKWHEALTAEETVAVLAQWTEAATRVGGQWVALDLETTGLDFQEDRVLAVGLCRGKDSLVFAGRFLESRKVVNALRKFLNHRSIKVAGHNIRFDAQFLLYRHKIEFAWDFDTMLAHYLLDERQGSHSLKTLARYYFNASNYEAEVKPFFRTGREAPPFEILLPYLVQDITYTHALIAILEPQLEEQGLGGLFRTLLLPADRAFRDIEISGARIDRAYLADLHTRFSAEAADLAKQMSGTAIAVATHLTTLAGQADDEVVKAGLLKQAKPLLNFSPNSPQQVATILYDYLGLKVPRGFKKRCTDKEVLEKLPGHPFVELLQRYRKCVKVDGTYAVGLLDRADKDDRLHPSFLLHGTVTGRLSCQNPSLQTIPHVDGPIVRNAFVAAPGHFLFEADYSQVELRVASFLAADEALRDAFLSGHDFHRTVAAEAIFHIPVEEVTKEQRYKAKFVNFGIAYGRKAKSLAEGELQCSVSEAQQYIDAWFALYHRFKAWSDLQTRLAQQRGYVLSAFGRRRRFPLITAQSLHDVANQATNAPIQSTASDLCLSSLVRIHNRLWPAAKLVSSIHDAVLGEAAVKDAETTILSVFEIMHDVPPAFGDWLPFPIGIKVGTRWGELEEFDNAAEAIAYVSQLGAS